MTVLQLGSTHAAHLSLIAVDNQIESFQASLQKGVNLQATPICGSDFFLRAPLSDRHCTCDSSLLCKDCNMWHDAAEEENLHWIALFYETRAAYEFGGACGPFVVHLI